MRVLSLSHKCGHTGRENSRLGRVALTVDLFACEGDEHASMAPVAPPMKPRCCPAARSLVPGVVARACAPGRARRGRTGPSGAARGPAACRAPEGPCGPAAPRPCRRGRPPLCPLRTDTLSGGARGCGHASAIARHMYVYYWRTRVQVLTRNRSPALPAGAVDSQARRKWSQSLHASTVAKASDERGST